MVGAMLNSGPWNRLALSVRWLRPEFSVPFPAQFRPPPHMRLLFGALPVTASDRLEPRAKKHTSQKARKRRVPAADASIACDEPETESAHEPSCPVLLTRCTICKQSLHVRVRVSACIASFIVLLRLCLGSRVLSRRSTLLRFTNTLCRRSTQTCARASLPAAPALRIRARHLPDEWAEQGAECRSRRAFHLCSAQPPAARFKLTCCAVRTPVASRSRRRRLTRQQAHCSLQATRVTLLSDPTRCLSSH